MCEMTTMVNLLFLVPEICNKFSQIPKREKNKDTFFNQDSLTMSSLL